MTAYMPHTLLLLLLQLLLVHYNIAQVHLLKLFDNVKALAFARNGRTVTAMSSSEGESFELAAPVTAEGPVEVWMTAIEQEMFRSLRGITKEGIFRYAKEPRADWIASVLGMVSLAGSQVMHYILQEVTH
jgi:dynein heavy chain, axonemal